MAASDLWERVGYLPKAAEYRKEFPYWVLKLDVWRRGRDRRFAESNEDELPADGMPGQLKCRHGLETRTSFSGSVGSGFFGITARNSVGKCQESF